MKVLLLTFYYPPDLSAGSFRASALVEALLRSGGPDLQIDVLTSQPNRYASYREVARAAAEVASDSEPRPASDQVSVTRLPVGMHHGGLVDQTRVFSGFARRALRSVRGRRYDLVVATSSRLFTGLLGAVIAGRTGANLYLDVRDLFVHNMRDMFRRKRVLSLLTPVLSFLESETFRRAVHVNLVSEGFLGYCKERFPTRRYSVFSNGIDPEFLHDDFRKPPSSGPKRIVYAGNLGLGQGIETVVPEAAHRLGDGYEFRIIGDGGRRADLEQALGGTGVDNVTLMPPMSRASLKREYRDADYLLLHLNGFSAMESVLPSKVFEYAATGKPILAGVRGYARRFIAEEVSGAAVFEPGNAGAMVEATRSLAPQMSDRGDFKRRFAREPIMDRMAAEIMSLAGGATAA